jgi:hypothetical protein
VQDSASGEAGRRNPSGEGMCREEVCDGPGGRVGAVPSACGTSSRLQSLAVETVYLGRQHRMSSPRHQAELLRPPGRRTRNHPGAGRRPAVGFPSLSKSRPEPRHARGDSEAVRKLERTRSRNAKGKQTTRRRIHWPLCRHGQPASSLALGSLSFWSFALCPLIFVLPVRTVSHRRVMVLEPRKASRRGELPGGTGQDPRESRSGQVGLPAAGLRRRSKGRRSARGGW